MKKRVALIASILSFVLVPGVIQAQKAADADFDGGGTVDFADFVEFAGAYGSDQAEYDLNGNGSVDFPDFVVFAQLYGQVVPPTIIVNSTADSGLGTLRQALLDAQSGGTITFDPTIFPPDAPDTITLTSRLPAITQGSLTIDGSNAGVVLDGSGIEPVSPSRDFGLRILSDANVIRGLQIIRSPGAAVGVVLGSKNIIGGDRGIGAGPLGQGNLLSGNASAGIVIWNEDSSLNTVLGNYVGTDLSGLHPLPNNGGIMIELGAHDNVIGPDNIIAHNKGDGISISLNALGNTITGNSVHDNGGDGIGLSRGGNNELLAPLILDFDLSAGSLTGWTYPNSTVEIFSDSTGEGRFYEGRAEADNSGAFALRNEAAFTGPHLTTNVTDPDGSTSEFSEPTRGSSGTSSLQGDNTLAMIRLQSKSSSQLPADVRLGTIFYDLGWAELPNLPDLVYDVTGLGAKRVDTTMNDFEPPIEEWSTTETETDIPIEYDEFIDSMNENGVAVNYVLLFWDKVGHANGEELPDSRFRTDEEVQEFLDYVRYTVNHFKGRVQYYTLWGEQYACPSIKCVAPDDYVELARKTIPVIREEDPQARVVTGPPVLQHARDAFFTLLRSDVIKDFDVISTHPFFDAAPDNIEEYGNYYYEYPALVDSILQTAVAHEFTGTYWGYSLTWMVSGGHTQVQTMKYMARGLVMHLGIDAGTGTGPFLNAGREPVLYYLVAHLYTILAGSEPVDLSVAIEGEATDILSYGFTLPNGDTLLALWTDGAAVDEDPGVKTTLTFPGMSSSRVTANDVLDGLDGFEQELIVETASGDLVIRNLLVRDYPIIVRITD